MIALDFVRRALAPGVVLCAAILAGGAQAQGDDALPILKKCPPISAVNPLSS